MSGTGTIAEGVEFHDGQVAISWFGQHHILEVAPNIDTWVLIHGHQGKTEVVWDMHEMFGHAHQGPVPISGQD